MMKQRLLVDVANRQKIRLPIRRIKAIAKEVFEKEGKVGELSIAFVDDNEIKELNKRFLGKDKPTDVLSFQLNESMGEVIISTDTAKRQAIEYGISFISEISVLLIHGLLHILGYNHSKEMRQKEEFYLGGFKEW
ncbi:MAG: rRNA maturation RNase YbeY [bacterium]